MFYRFVLWTITLGQYCCLCYELIKHNFAIITDYRIIIYVQYFPSMVFFFFFSEFVGTFTSSRPRVSFRTGSKTCGSLATVNSYTIQVVVFIRCIDFKFNFQTRIEFSQYKLTINKKQILFCKLYLFSQTKQYERISVYHSYGVYINTLTVKKYNHYNIITCYFIIIIIVIFFFFLILCFLIHLPQ